MKPSVIFQSTRNPRDPLPQRPQQAFTTEIPGLEVSENVENSNIVEEVTVNESEEFVGSTQEMLDAFNLSDDENSSDPITIPVFNFSTSNTTSQNLINLLSNPLRHTANATTSFTPFGDSFEAEDDEDDECEIPENIPPNILHIDYVPEIVEQESTQPRDNITVIKIAESENLSQPRRIKDDPKVTKIKIEMDYDKLKNASTVQVASIVVEAAQNQHEAASTSAANGVVAKETKEILKVEKPTPVPVTPKKMPPETPKRTPMHEKRKLSLREKQVVQLKQEINTEIRFKLRKKDCVDSIALVSAFGSVWIAGFKPNPLLYCLHIGDQLLAINNIVIKSPSDAQKYIKMCSGLFVEVTIRRLPLAGIFLIKREFENQCLGIIRDGSSPAIVEIIPNSISSHIPPRPNTADEDSCWIITQINFRNIGIISQKRFDETELLLNTSGLECCLLLQPSEFIAKIKKELKNLKNYRDYTLQ
jgi:hypothetical protein